MEVDLSQLALTRANNADVKKHAQQVIADQEKINEELKIAAGKKNFVLPASMTKKMQGKHDALSKLNGKQFDEKYIKCMVHKHKKTLCLFKKESKRGKDADLKQWAASKLPMLEQRVDKGKETCKALKKAN